MNRCKVSLGILIAIIALCITGLFIVSWQCRSFGEQITAISDAVHTGDTQKALEEFDALQAQWKQFHNITGIFIDGSDLDTIKETLSGVRPMLETEHPEAPAELERLRSLVEGLYEEEFPEIWHIL